MRDIEIKISKKRQKVELLTLLVCFVIAYALNVYSIVAYDGKWSELFWSLGFVVLTAVVLYVVWSVLRICFYYIKKCITKKK